MENGQLRTRLLQQVVEVTAPGAIHKLDGNFQLPFPDGFEIDQFTKLFKIIGPRVKSFAAVGPDDGALKRPFLRLEPLNIRLNDLRDLRNGRGAVAGGKLQTLVFGRIMT